MMKLKPCPFCGGHFKIYRGGGSYLYRHESNGCILDNFVMGKHSSYVESWKKWNHRSQISEQPASTEQPQAGSDEPKPCAVSIENKRLLKNSVKKYHTGHVN